MKSGDIIKKTASINTKVGDGLKARLHGGHLRIWIPWGKRQEMKGVEFFYFFLISLSEHFFVASRDLNVSTIDAVRWYCSPSQKGWPLFFQEFFDLAQGCFYKWRNTTYHLLFSVYFPSEVTVSVGILCASGKKNIQNDFVNLLIS